MEPTPRSFDPASNVNATTCACVAIDVTTCPVSADGNRDGVADALGVGLAGRGETVWPGSAPGAVLGADDAVALAVGVAGVAGWGDGLARRSDRAHAVVAASSAAKSRIANRIASRLTSRASASGPSVHRGERPGGPVLHVRFLAFHPAHDAGTTVHA